AGGRIRSWRVKTALDLAPDIGRHPLSGHMEASYDGVTGKLALAPSWLLTRSTRLEISGTWGERLALTLRSADLAAIEPLLPAELRARGGPPIALESGGSLQFHGTVRGSLDKPQLEGHVSLRSFRAGEWSFDLTTGDVEVSPDSVGVRQALIKGREFSLTGSLRAALHGGKLAHGAPVHLAASLETPDVAKLIARLGAGIAVSGRLKASVMASGTLAQPDVKAHWELASGTVLGERVERLAGEATYRDHTLAVRRLEARAGGATVRLFAAYRHDKDDPARGNLLFELAAQRLDAGALNVVKRAAPATEAILSGQAKGEIRVANDALRLVALAGKATITRLSWQGVRLGELSLQASTIGSILSLDARGRVGGADLVGCSRWDLGKNYAGSGEIAFGRMRLSEWLSRVGATTRAGAGGPSPKLPLEVIAEGKLAFQAASLPSGPWNGTLELGRLELEPRALRARAEALTLRNDGPWIIAGDAEQARIRKARLVGQGVTLDISGGFRMASRYPLDLRCQGSADLALLGALDPALRAGGTLVVD
ncbi:MAG: hypothetical protein ACPL88_09060, partial [Bryobacteraceae bacterium]